ncbi:MAG: hypothetical protein OHK0038_03100 [Flammeovirgaceae bacterium]
MLKPKTKKLVLTFFQPAMENFFKRVFYTTVGITSKTATELQKSENEWAVRGKKELESFKWHLLHSTENLLIKAGILHPEQMPDVNTWEE